MIVSQCALDISRSYFIEDFTKDTPWSAREVEVWGVVREYSLAEIISFHLLSCMYYRATDDRDI